MKKLALTIGAVAMVGFAGSALADQGGEPNDNANNQTGQGDPQGRKGQGCNVPGTVSRVQAQVFRDGGVAIVFGPPGQDVKQFCTPS